MYPELEIDIKKLKNNVKDVLRIANENNVEIVGVVKAVNGIREIVEALIDCGIKTIASSRLPQLKLVKEINPDILTYDLRIPMLSELDELVQCTDISLNSNLVVLEKLNEAAKNHNKIHNVILMLECGDLREGIYDEDEMLEVASKVENDFNNLHLMGVGTNLGCYGSIMPTPEKMNELLGKAKLIEEKIGRKLEVVSGAASTAFPMVARGALPEGITQMRMGDCLYVSDLDECFEYEMFEEDKEAFKLKAEVIEVYEKPSHPIGTISVDAFGNKKEYVDKGIRKRALIAVGRQDIGDCMHLRPLDKKLEIMGGSSDHTILDITDCDIDYKVGDIIEFYLMYENLLMSCQSEYVNKIFIN